MFYHSVTQFEWISSYKHLLISMHFLPSLSSIILPNSYNLIESQDIWFFLIWRPRKDMAWGHPACLVAEPRLETRFWDSQFNVLSYSICLPYKKGTKPCSLLLLEGRNRRQRLVGFIPYGFSDYLPNTTPRGRPLSGFKRRQHFWL